MNLLAVPSNSPMHVTVWSVTARAKSAWSTPAQPAPDAERWADMKVIQ